MRNFHRPRQSREGKEEAGWRKFKGERTKEPSKKKRKKREGTTPYPEKKRKKKNRDSCRYEFGENKLSSSEKKRGRKLSPRRWKKQENCALKSR